MGPRPAEGTVWTARECAEQCGLSDVHTWRGYVRGRKGMTGVPQPLPELNADGLMVWDAQEVWDWHDRRRGEGWRKGISRFTPR